MMWDHTLGDTGSKNQSLGDGEKKEVRVKKGGCKKELGQKDGA